MANQKTWSAGAVETRNEALRKGTWFMAEARKLAGVIVVADSPEPCQTVYRKPGWSCTITEWGDDWQTLAKLAEQASMTMVEPWNKEA